MSFGDHMQCMRLIASIEGAIRAREDRLTYCLHSAELLPENTLQLLVQPSKCKLEMKRDALQLSADLSQQIESFDADGGGIELRHKLLMRSVLNCLIDSRHYGALFASFGAIYVHTDESDMQLGRSSVFCLQNRYELRRKQALVLQFAVQQAARPRLAERTDGGILIAIQQQPSFLRRSMRFCTDSYLVVRESGSRLLQSMRRRK